MDRRSKGKCHNRICDTAAQPPTLIPLSVRPLGRVFESRHLDVDAAELAWPRRRAGQGEGDAVVTHIHYRVMRKDAVGVLVHDRKAGRFLMVEQYRYPAAAKGTPVLVEIPAGVIEDGETPEETAVREVREEIGVRIHRLQPITTAFASPGYSDERLHLFHAEVEDIIDDGGGVDLGERTRRRSLTHDEAHRLFAAGQIRDLKTFAALAWFFARRRP